MLDFFSLSYSIDIIWIAHAQNFIYINCLQILLHASRSNLFHINEYYLIFITLLYLHLLIATYDFCNTLNIRTEFNTVLNGEIRGFLTKLEKKKKMFRDKNFIGLTILLRKNKYWTDRFYYSKTGQHLQRLITMISLSYI